MLGIDAVVAAPVPVARENVDAFVNSLRFVPRSKCKFRRKNRSLAFSTCWPRLPETKRK